MTRRMISAEVVILTDEPSKRALFGKERGQPGRCPG
jgi:hypothetical protein